MKGFTVYRRTQARYPLVEVVADGADAYGDTRFDTYTWHAGKRRWSGRIDADGATALRDRHSAVGNRIHDTTTA